MFNDANLAIEKRIAELEKEADKKYKWLTKNINSNCFDDVTREYNSINQHIESQRNQLDNLNRTPPAGEWTGDFPTAQKLNCFTSIHN